MSKIIISSRDKKHKQKKSGLLNVRTAASFLRHVTCGLVYGRKTPLGPRPVLKKAACIVRFNERGYGERWNTHELGRHQDGEETLYFFGSDDPRQRYTLVLKDVDVQKAGGLGTPEGAKAFAEHCKGLFQGSYWEPSTHEEGQHGYLLIDKEGYTAEMVKKGLKRLEEFLEHEAEGFDVERVEVKGTPPTVRWAGSKIDELTYGMLGKLPRKATLDDLQGLHVIRLTDLLRSDRFKVETVANKVSGGAGSVSFDFADDDKLDRLEALCAQFVPEGLKAGSRNVTARHFAVASAILTFTKDHPNKDGSTPTKRIKELWRALQDQGLAVPCFEAQTWKVIRDTLSDLGLIDATDGRYWWHEDGRKGQAMRWQITDAFHELLVEAVAGPVGAVSEVSQDTTHTSLYTQGKTSVSEAVADPVGAVSEVSQDTTHTHTHTSLYTQGKTSVSEALGQGTDLIPQRIIKLPQKEVPWWDEHILETTGLAA